MDTLPIRYQHNQNSCWQWLCPGYYYGKYIHLQKIIYVRKKRSNDKQHMQHFLWSICQSNYWLSKWNKDQLQTCDKNNFEFDWTQKIPTNKSHTIRYPSSWKGYKNLTFQGSASMWTRSSIQKSTKLLFEGSSSHNQLDFHINIELLQDQIPVFNWKV